MRRKIGKALKCTQKEAKILKNFGLEIALKSQKL